MRYLANWSSVYSQRFSAHLWNNVRSSRLRLHQVVLRQCRIVLSSYARQDDEQVKTQQAKSTAKIESLAIEISATIPQLAGYVEKLEYRRQHPEHVLPVRHVNGDIAMEGFAASQIGKLSATGSIDYSTHFGGAPSPFRRGDPTPSNLKQTSVFYADCNDGGLNVDAPTQIFPPVGGLQPASVYHMLFQLYPLRSLASLPRSLRDWIHERILWMEQISDTDDLARLQDMMAKRPGDGFPVDGEG
jgi:hypothetical protein